jgi:hypothetical protein
VPDESEVTSEWKEACRTWDDLCRKNWGQQQVESAKNKADSSYRVLRPSELSTHSPRSSPNAPIPKKNLHSNASISPRPSRKKKDFAGFRVILRRLLGGRLHEFFDVEG